MHAAYENRGSSLFFAFAIVRNYKTTENDWRRIYTYYDRYCTFYRNEIEYWDRKSLCMTLPVPTIDCKSYRPYIRQSFDSLRDSFNTFTCECRHLFNRPFRLISCFLPPPISWCTRTREIMAKNHNGGSSVSSKMKKSLKKKNKRY